MRTPVRLLPLAAAALLAGCVTLEEPPMAQKPLTSKERLLLVVYPSPGPVFYEEDSKAETAAKIVPGLGLIVKDVQDQHNTKSSQELQQYLPGWNAGADLDGIIRKQLVGIGPPSAVIGPADSGVGAAVWAEMNRASDVLDWQMRYFIKQPELNGPSRNYSKFLSLDDCVVLEINFAYTLESTEIDGQPLYAPGARAVTKLLRANTMHQLWRHENTVTAANAAARTLYDFKSRPNELLASWKALLPRLSTAIMEDLRKNLSQAGVPLDPYKSQRGDPAAGGNAPLLSGPGWAPVAVAASSTTASATTFKPHPSTP